MNLTIPQPAKWMRSSPFWIVGAVILLAVILMVLALKNVHREKEFMERALLSQARVLMRSVEAGSRTGMTGMGWGYRQRQLLIEETAQQTDVLYVALVTTDGTLLAHSDPARVGSALSFTLPRANETAFRFTHENREAFEVTRAYEPWFRQRGGGSWETCSFNNHSSERNLFIVVGLDTSPFKEAQRQDTRQMGLLSGVLFVLGGAGFLSLFWAQNYWSARSSLQDMRAFTSTLINQMPVGLLATNAEGRIRKANEAARNILRQNGNMDGFIHDFPCFASIVERLRREERIPEQEIHCLVNGGERVPLLVNAAVLRDAEGKESGQVYLFTDITAIKHLEEQLRRSERLASLGNLAAGVAHEIRNPLSSIKGFAAILGERFKKDEESRQLADVMVREVDRLNRVVTELLDFARPTDLQKRLCACREILESSFRLVGPDAHDQGVVLESTVIPEDLLMDVDPDRFIQVLLNLYLNALHAMVEGGKLEVRIAREGERAVWTIADSGTGIPAEHLPHVFDPYFTTKPSGVGLGLANVHKFVEAHGGEIEVASEPGAGTTFRIALPLPRESQTTSFTGEAGKAA